MAQEIQFTDSENPAECEMAGQLTTVRDLPAEDVAFLKQIFDIFVRIVKLWLAYGKGRQAMVTALAQMQKTLQTEECVTTVRRVGFLKSAWMCNFCNIKTEGEPSNFCPGCGYKIQKEK